MMLTQSSSPVEKVASVDDLLTEILLRLPVRPLLRFMSVSKHWYSLISNPSFKLIHSRNPNPNPNPNPPSGLILPVETCESDSRPHIEWKLIPINVQNPVRTPNFNFVDENVEQVVIYSACNGLMLCENNKKVYVYNPTTNQFIMIPELEIQDKSYRIGMMLIFDPAKSPHYKIIIVTAAFEFDGEIRQKFYRIEMYSSQTRSCKLVTSYFPGDNEWEIETKLGAGVFWNDAVHWLGPTGLLLYLDLDLDLDEEEIHRIHTPFYTDGVKLNYWDDRKYICKIYESRGHLLVVEVSMPLTSRLKIYELNTDYSGWFVKYDVDFKGVSRLYPDIAHPMSPAVFQFSVPSIVLGEEKEEDDSFLVLEFPGKVIRYNLASKTFHTLYDLPSQCGGLLFQCVFQFVESLFCF